MIWASISSKGKLTFKFVDGTMNAKQYLDLLKEFIPDYPNSKFGNNYWRFQHDNAPCHKAIIVRD